MKNDDQGRVARVEVWARDPLPPGTDDSLHRPALQTFFEYGYHPEGELAHQMNARGHAEEWDYDGKHRMTRAQIRNGVSFYYQYDEDLDYCTRTWGDEGVHDVRLEIEYAAGETRTYGTNRARRYLWKNGRVVREETFGGDWAVERQFDGDGLLIAAKDGAGNETHYEYDARGHLVQRRPRPHGRAGRRGRASFPHRV